MLSSVTMYWVGGREGEERRGEGRGGGKRRVGVGVKRVIQVVVNNELAKLTTFFPLWGGMNLGWMKEQPLARASNGPGPGGRSGHMTIIQSYEAYFLPRASWLVRTVLHSIHTELSSPAVCIALYGGSKQGKQHATPTIIGKPQANEHFRLL